MSAKFNLGGVESFLTPENYKYVFFALYSFINVRVGSQLGHRTPFWAFCDNTYN
jgi:hypothetical protein